MPINTNTTQTVLSLAVKTVNRGVKPYIVTVNKNGKYLAHEVGELTTIAKLLGGEERRAYRINKLRRYCNQYRAVWKPKPYTTIEEATKAIVDYANQDITHY